MRGIPVSDFLIYKTRFAKVGAAPPAPTKPFEMTVAKDNAAEEGFSDATRAQIHLLSLEGWALDSNANGVELGDQHTL